MRIQLSFAALACAALTFAGGGVFSSGHGIGGGNGQAKTYSLPNNTPLRQYTVHMGKGGQVSAQSGPATLYSNLTNYTGFYLPGTTLAAPMDDLHMTSAGTVNGYSFVYYDPAGNTALSTVEVGIFTNDAVDSSPYTQTLIYDQFLTGLPGDGLYQINVDLTGGGEFAAPADLWMGIAFGAGISDSTEAGWVTFDPPTIGSSHDLMFDFATGQNYSFGANPVANFGAAIYATPEPASVVAIATGLVGLFGLRRRMKA